MFCFRNSFAQVGKQIVRGKLIALQQIGNEMCLLGGHNFDAVPLPLPLPCNVRINRGPMRSVQGGARAPLEIRAIRGGK